MLDVELGALDRLYRITLLFRTYFGDTSSYLLGGRAEIGPRWGNLRLSFGADMGLLFVPDTVDNIDMLVFNLHLAGLVVEWSHVLVHLDAFALDFYVIPANTELDRDIEGLFGLSSGVSVAVHF